MGRLIYAAVIITVIALLSSCASVKAGSGVDPADVWNDAALLAGARAELEQLRNEYRGMELAVGEVSQRIERLAEELAVGIERSGNIGDLFREIDKFVRELIAENSRLRGLYGADRAADAGEG